MKELREKTVPFDDQDLNSYLKNLVRRGEIAREMNRTTRSFDRKQSKTHPNTVKSLLFNTHLEKLKNNSQERSLKKHE